MLYTTYRSRPARPEMMMDRMIREFCGMPERRRPNLVFPVDVRQTGEAYLIEAELPGVKLADIDISVENDVLTIAADVNNVQHGDSEGYVHTERASGHMERSFTLEGIRQEGITATCVDGVLTIVLPKEIPAAEKGKRRIAVNGAAPIQPEVAKIAASTEA